MTKPRQPAPAPTTDPVEPCLTAVEVSKVIRVCPRTAKRMIRTGEIRGRLVAGRWLVIPADLRRFLEEAPTTWSFGPPAGSGQ